MIRSTSIQIQTKMTGSIDCAQLIKRRFLINENPSIETYYVKKMSCCLRPACEIVNLHFLFTKNYRCDPRSVHEIIETFDIDIGVWVSYYLQLTLRIKQITIPGFLIQHSSICHRHIEHFFTFSCWKYCFQFDRRFAH